jgi:DNA-binding transcriptional ArsR family regulator
VTGLLKASSSDMRTAQRALDLLGDPLRRTLLEQLARGPRKMSPTFLAEIGCNIGDCLHRIRALRREELIRRAKFQSYIINPHAVPPLCLYIDVLITAGSLSDEGFCMDFDIDLVLEALSSSTRRRLFESIVIKPRSIVQLVDMVPVTRQSVAQHVQVLLDAGLVQYEGKMVKATLSQLPRLRTYFDRLWLEASLGETWLSERYGDRMAALT